MSKIKKYVFTTVTVLFMSLTMLVSFSIVRANMTHTPPKLFNRSLFMIVSGSMSPNINKGDLIMIEYVDTNSIKVGDVITFNYKIGNQTVPNTHRVIEVNSNGTFTTHGDANPEGSNETVAVSDVIGRYNGFRIQKIGNAITYLAENPTYIFILVVGFGVLIIIMEIKNFIASYLEAKKEELNKKNNP
jgi:signal peptidase